MALYYNTKQHQTTIENYLDTKVLQIWLLLALRWPTVPGGQQLRGHVVDFTFRPDRTCHIGEYARTADCKQTSAHLECRKGIAMEWLKGVHHHIRQLTVAEWPGHCINVDPLQLRFPELRDLKFFNSSSVTTFKGNFKTTSKIERLSIHGLTSLLELPPEFVVHMQVLRELDLRRNQLRHMRARTIRDPPALQRVYMSENKWDCSDSGLDWLAMEPENGTARRRIADYGKLICNQQLYRGKPLHKVMDIIRTVRTTCPSPCACAMTHVVSDSAGVIIPLITVDCAGRRLPAPPTSLPPSTTTLRLESNKINNIRAILQNPQYKQLVDLYLDNNSIPSVKELEGSEWFSKFRVLSLRGNLLRQVPVYAFDKAFQNNHNIVGVYLGNNPWRCDCHYAPRFQNLLLKYKRIIRDLSDIKCSGSETETSMLQISTMLLSTVCKSGPVMPISTINIVNIVLASLILIILGRFLYDWHNFKTTGKLPWLSSILP